MCIKLQHSWLMIPNHFSVLKASSVLKGLSDAQGSQCFSQGRRGAIEEETGIKLGNDDSFCVVDLPTRSLPYLNEPSWQAAFPYRWQAIHQQKHHCLVRDSYTTTWSRLILLALKGARSCCKRGWEWSEERSLTRT